MARKHIDEHTLKVLEFDQVRRILASFASSVLGEAAAMVVYPSLDSDWISQRTAETTELKNLLEQDVAIPLAGLNDIGGLITGLGRGKTVFEPAQLLQIADTLSASGRIKQFLEKLPRGKAMRLRQLTDRLHDFAPLVDEINRCVEDEESIRDEASPKLKEIRRQIREFHSEIERRFRAIVSSPEMQKAIENDKLVMRHGRVVVAVKTRYRHRLRGIVLDRSNTGVTLFIEPEQLVELRTCRGKTSPSFFY